MGKNSSSAKVQLYGIVVLYQEGYSERQISIVSFKSL